MYIAIFPTLPSFGAHARYVSFGISWRG